MWRSSGPPSEKQTTVFLTILGHYSPIFIRRIAPIVTFGGAAATLGAAPTALGLRRPPLSIKVTFMSPWSFPRALEPCHSLRHVDDLCCSLLRLHLMGITVIAVQPEEGETSPRNREDSPTRSPMTDRVGLNIFHNTVLANVQIGYRQSQCGWTGLRLLGGASARGAAARGACAAACPIRFRISGPSESETDSGSLPSSFSEVASELQEPRISARGAAVQPQGLWAVPEPRPPAPPAGSVSYRYG